MGDVFKGLGFGLKVKPAKPLIQLSIDSLDHEARGVGRLEGKVVFVEGALPHESVTAERLKKKTSYDTAKVVSVERESWMRVQPRCKYFGICGGCLMQHLDAGAQVAVKQRLLEDAFVHLAGTKPEQVLAPIHGPSWGYRYRARLTVRLVAKKGGILVGFHERRSSFVADMTSCEVLPRSVSDLLVPLREMIGLMSAPTRFPQIELAVGQAVIAMVLRHLDPLTDGDKQVLRDFARSHGVQWWLQSKGPDTVCLLDKSSAEPLTYALPAFGISMPFRPTDFTQVNHQINQVLVSRALSLLGVSEADHVLDLFCGLGNFTLPLARVSQQVLGVEGSQVLVDRAHAAALHNAIENVVFQASDLFTFSTESYAMLMAALGGRIDRVLIDPPREGALAVCDALSQLQGKDRPKRIVYVSCNPATLARDAGVLEQQGGYRLKQAGVVNMFPHTGHVESIAVFE